MQKLWNLYGRNGKFCATFNATFKSGKEMRKIFNAIFYDPMSSN